LKWNIIKKVNYRKLNKKFLKILVNLWDDDPHVDIESSRKKSQADKSQIELNSKFDKQEVLQIPISTVRSDGNIESMPKELKIVESHEQERHKNLAIKDSA